MIGDIDALPVHTSAKWDEMLKAMHSGEVFRLDQETYDYWLEVLPPVYMFKDQTVKGDKIRCTFGFAEGAEQITDFWNDRGRLLGCRSERWHDGS